MLQRTIRLNKSFLTVFCISLIHRVFLEVPPPNLGEELQGNDGRSTSYKTRSIGVLGGNQGNRGASGESGEPQGIGQSGGGQGEEKTEDDPVRAIFCFHMHVQFTASGDLRRPQP